MNTKLFVFLAVIIISLGVIFAVNNLTDNATQTTTIANPNSVDNIELVSRYFTDADVLSVAPQDPANFSIVLFTESWDSHSYRLSEYLRNFLIDNPHALLQVIELDMSTNRTLASEFGVSTSSTIVTLGKDGEVMKILYNPTNLDLNRFLTDLIP